MLAVLELRVIVACHIDLAPDDWLDLEMPGCLVNMFVCELEELLDSVHVTVVSDSQGRHSHLLGPVKQSRDCGETVKNRVLCVDVKVNKSHGDKSIFQSSKQTARHPIFSFRLRADCDSTKIPKNPIPAKPPSPKSYQQFGKSPDFTPLKLGTIPDRIMACDTG